VQKLFIKASRFERWGAGRTIVREGHPAQYFYILLDGELAVTIVDKAALEAAVLGTRRAGLGKGVLTIKKEDAAEMKGRESDMERTYIRDLGVIQSGDTFGDLSFRSSSGLRPMTIKTTRPCEMLLIEKELYLEIMHSEASNFF
jgi:CRP-like cAMP-binding protein